MGYLCFLGLVMIVGAFGGIIFSLSLAPHEAQRIGFFRSYPGQAVIGAFAGLLLVSLAIAQLNFDISAAITLKAKPFSTTNPLGRDGFIVVLHTIALSLIGGFLGLKLITKVAEGSIEDIALRLNVVEGKRLPQLERQLPQIENRLPAKEPKDSALMLATLARILRSEGDLVAAEAQIKRSLAIEQTKFGEFVYGMILRSQGRLREAIDALKRAADQPEDSFLQDNASVFWNTACYVAILDPTRAGEVIHYLDKSLFIRESLRPDILTDADLRGVLDTPGFREHFHL